MAFPPEICVVSGYVYNLDGTPNVETYIEATVESTLDDQGGQVDDGTGIASVPIETFTDDSGFFQLSLVQGTRVRLSIPAINLRKLVSVPIASTAEFSDLV